jgi:hypothetical protein
MTLSYAIRIVNDKLRTGSVRATYWNAAQIIQELRLLLTTADATVRAHFLRDLWRFWTGTVQPVRGQAMERVYAAAEWLIRAQSATSDDGVSLGYFPCDSKTGAWRPSYPETTGYIISTLLAFARRYGATQFLEAAIRMARWEIAIQMPSGAVQGGPVVGPEKQTAAAFNTGMVLDGWCSAYLETRDVAFFDAARRAANFLVNDIDDAGYFKTNGQFVSRGEIKTYTCLCGWALFRFGNLARESKYSQSATRCVEAAVRSQHANGWFPHNCLSRSHAPLTHTIGYTLQGVVEVGVLAGRSDFIDAARRGIEPVIAQIDDSGFLAGRFFSDWRPASFSSCLTGSAQIAIVCYRLGEITGEARFAECADRLVDYLKSLQTLSSKNAALNGALAGSFPILGEYMRAGYPNWATKYFVDSLMLQDSRHRAHA